jgi:solute carrier family 25 phosphate transporter 23/24/25/41
MRPRDFLLFIPASAPNLLAVMSYFSATMKVNPEGDVLISDDTIQGLGTAQRFLQFFFGSLFLVARTPPYTSFPSDYNETPEMASPPDSSLTISHTPPPRSRGAGELHSPLTEVQTELEESFGTVLIACVPHAGYFVAGGIAGIVSRTSTAPLDRLKVYLIAQTSAVADEAVAAAKHGNIFRAVSNAWKPLSTAMKELWHAGGMRSLYAGELFWSSCLRKANNHGRKRSQCDQSHARISYQVRFLRGKYLESFAIMFSDVHRQRNVFSLRLKDTMTQQLYIRGPNLWPVVLQVR